MEETTSQSLKTLSQQSKALLTLCRDMNEEVQRALANEGCGEIVLISLQLRLRDVLHAIECIEMDINN